MTLITKISNGAEYLYFQAGLKSMYIAPKNDHSKAKIENVIKALEYTQERMGTMRHPMMSFYNFYHQQSAENMQDR